ncbi:hypothetical protein BOVATA_035360 [Babesia ovata]|uniref:Uncharacterized protein n=1 Tax=Babesia ovata TaxID=189622 RepID=A0A2H6KGB6_9APIC|nr:uncharacterized protein BOVATA_035360 [Babesia ovata]GBE62043.1 hypothetical protein BOVATA_035360 [Babesia ovata]
MSTDIASPFNSYPLKYDTYALAISSLATRTTYFPADVMKHFMYAPHDEIRLLIRVLNASSEALTRIDFGELLVDAADFTGAVASSEVLTAAALTLFGCLNDATFFEAAMASLVILTPFASTFSDSSTGVFSASTCFFFVSADFSFFPLVGLDFSTGASSAVLSSPSSSSLRIGSEAIDFLPFTMGRAMLFDFDFLDFSVSFIIPPPKAFTTFFMSRSMFSVENSDELFALRAALPPLAPSPSTAFTMVTAQSLGGSQPAFQVGVRCC